VRPDAADITMKQMEPDAAGAGKTPNPEEGTMTEAVNEVKVGMQVPDFTLTCYDPRKHDFTKVSLGELKNNGKWTVLFFYPADFTFV